MGDGPGNIKVIPHYFDTLSSTTASSQQRGSDTLVSCEDYPCTSTFGAGSQSQENLCASHRGSGSSSCLRGLLFSGSNGEENVELSAAQLKSLRSELADVEEREAHFKAQLEHLDEILRCARLSGYLYIRTRWAALPGEPPPIDDSDVDDWIPRFVVLQGSCIFFYLSSTDLSPQDSTLLSEISEVVELPSFVRENEEIWHCFYIGTRYGLRIECSSVSRIQVDSWLTALKTDCEFGPDKANSMDEKCKYDSQNCS